MTRQKPMTFAVAARMLAHAALEYTGVPDGRGGYTHPTEIFLDADIRLYNLAREVLRLLPKQRRPTGARR